MSAQVFVDDSGRRRRWVRLAGAAVTALCVGYIGIFAIGLSQTQVGPLAEVPQVNNGQISGFQDPDGTVPGLLQTGSAKSTGQGGHAAVPVRKPTATVPPRTSAPKPTEASKVPVPPTASATAKPDKSTSKPTTAAPPTSGPTKEPTKEPTETANSSGSKGT